jgi:hypothetical protein
MRNLTQERLKELIEYDPETGMFRRRVIIGNNSVKDWTKGSIGKRGCYTLSVDGYTYKAHRLAYLYMVGNWPRHLVDHKDCDPQNNRWDNLRKATPSENSANKKFYSQYGAKGIVKSKDRWSAQIRMEGKRFYLGTYDTIEEAHAAYCGAGRVLHGEFFRTT